MEKKSKEQLEQYLKKFNQEHLLSFYASLSNSQKTYLSREIDSLDIDLINSISKDLIQSGNGCIREEDLMPLTAPDVSSFSASEKERITRIGNKQDFAAFAGDDCHGSRHPFTISSYGDTQHPIPE